MIFFRTSLRAHGARHGTTATDERCAGSDGGHRVLVSVLVFRAFPALAFRAAGGMESAMRRSLREFSSRKGLGIVNDPAYQNGNCSSPGGT